MSHSPRPRRAATPSTADASSGRTARAGTSALPAVSDPLLARAAALTSMTGQLTWVVDQDGHAADDLPAWRAFTGLSRRAVRGDGWQRAIHPEDRSHLAALWNAEEDPTADARTVLLRICERQGAYHALRTRIAPVRLAGEGAREWLCCGDLTSAEPANESGDEPAVHAAEGDGAPPVVAEPAERTHLTTSTRQGSPNTGTRVSPRQWSTLRPSLALVAKHAEVLEAILDGVPDTLALFDRDGSLLWNNSVGHDTAGGPGIGLVGDGAFSAYSLRTAAGEPFPKDELPLERARRGEVAREVEMVVRRLNGQEAHLVVSAVPIYDRPGTLEGIVSISRDVTPLRHAEANAEARTAELRTVLDSIGDAIFVYDVAGRIVRANHAARAQFALATHPDYASRPFGERANMLDVRDSAGQPYPQEQWGLPNILRGRVIRHDEAPDILMRLPDGSESIFTVSGAPIRDASGQVVGAVSVLREMTERRRIEREAAQHLREIEVMFDSITDAAFVYDAQGMPRRINQSALKMLGIHVPSTHFDQPLDERARLFAVRDEHGQPLPREAWPQTRLLRGERLDGATAMDTILRSLDGRDLRLSSTGAPLRDEQGRITGAVMITRDVSERREMERRGREALEAILAMAEALVASAPEAPVTASAQSAGGPAEPDGDPFAPDMRTTARRLAELACRVLGCSRASLSVVNPTSGASRILAVAGLPPEQEQLWMRSVEQSKPEDYLDDGQLAELLAGRSVVLDFSRAREREQPTFGSQRTLVVPMRINGQVMGSISATYGPEEHQFSPDEIALGEAVGHLCSLVVERERLLSDRAASEARAWALEVATRRMDEFLGVVSHELRTPLTSIKATIQVTRRRLHSALFNGEIEATEQTRALPDLLVRAERQVGRLDALVNDLLDVTRIQSGKLQMRPAPHDLLDIVTEAVQDERLAWPGRDVVLEGEPRPTWRVRADADRIRQVVANFLTNALKYAPRAQPIVVNVVEEAGGGVARVSVRDQGPGVPQAEREQIWDLFHQVPNTQHLNGSGVGLGLGLHICKTIIERHGGQVGLESEPGVGSTFWFTLPLAGDADGAEARGR